MTRDTPEPGSGFSAWFAELQATSAVLRVDGVELIDVQLQVRDLTIGTARRVAGSLTGSAIVPFLTLARLAAPLGFSRVDEHTLHITNIEVMGRYTDADARVHVSGHDLIFSPAQVNVSGVSWLDRAIGRVAAEVHEVRRTIPGLPLGITLTRARVNEQGIVLELEGHDVPLG